MTLPNTLAPPTRMREAPAPEALELHERTVEDMWRRAHKGQAAATYMRSLIKNLPS